MLAVRPLGMVPDGPAAEGHRRLVLRLHLAQGPMTALVMAATGGPLLVAAVWYLVDAVRRYT